MGCWNGTCMVTNLPILVGDPVVCQIIVGAPFADPTHGAAETSYPHQRFVAVGYPFKAKYNDYGYVEDIQEDAYTADTLDYIRAKLIERPQGENKYHEQEVRRDLLTWESFDDWIDDGRILLENAVARPYPQYLTSRPVGMVMIHHAVYEAMVAYRPEWGWYAVEGEIKEALTIVPRDEPMRLIDEIRIKETLDRFIRERELNNPCDLGADIDETAARIAKMAYFDAALGLARKQWLPTSGAGSQSEEWDLFRLIAKTSEGIIGKREQELAEDEAEDALIEEATE